MAYNGHSKSKVIKALDSKRECSNDNIQSFLGIWFLSKVISGKKQFLSIFKYNFQFNFFET